MESKKYIVILGHCPNTQEELEACIQSIVTTDLEAEINFFDLPRKDGKDIVNKIGKTFVHRYAAGERKSEILRDILALSPSQVIYTNRTNRILRYIVNAVRNYGIEVIKMPC